MKKIIKHSFCKREKCSYVGKMGEIEETIKQATKESEAEYWVRLEDGKLGMFKESDFRITMYSHNLPLHQVARRKKSDMTTSQMLVESLRPWAVVAKSYCDSCNQILPGDEGLKTGMVCTKCKTKQKRAFSKIGEKNSMWKGDDVGYASLHNWVRRRKPKPEFCECCKTNPPYDLANISQEYKRDVNDFEWLCRTCHMRIDGRMKTLEKYRKKNFKKWRENVEEYPMFGKHHSVEAKKKISEKAKERLKDKKNHPFYGKHLSEEAKRKISKANKGRKPSEETRKKISISKIGNKNPNWRGGKPKCLNCNTEINRGYKRCVKCAAIVRGERRKEIGKQIRVNDKRLQAGKTSCEECYEK